MKILVVLNDLDIGGAQNYTISLMNEFVKRGHNVSLRILSNNLLLKERLNNDIEVKVWARKSKIDFSVIKNIRYELKSGKFSAIISSYINYQMIASLALPKLKTIYPLHSTIENDFKTFFINFITFRFKRSNEIFVTSIESQTEYLKSAYKLGKFFFTQIYNGVDTDKFVLPPSGFCREKFLEKIEVDPKKKIILIVAGFRKEKRHVDAFNAFKILREKRSDTVLICVGDNREKEKAILEQYVAANNIEDIKILSAREAGDVRNFFWCAELFTLTSNKVETFPISVLEAMASGLPCVLTNIGGNKDIIIDESYGKIVPLDDIPSIAESWSELLDNKRCKNTIRSYIVKRYSLMKSVDEYLKLMTE